MTGPTDLFGVETGGWILPWDDPVGRCLPLKSPLPKREPDLGYVKVWMLGRKWKRFSITDAKSFYQAVS